MILFVFWEVLIFVYYMIHQKIMNLRNLYRLYRLQKLKIRLKEVRIKRVGTSTELDKEGNEIDNIENADGIFDLLDANTASIKDDNFSPSLKDPTSLQAGSITRSKIKIRTQKMELRKEEIKLIQEINDLNSKVLPSKKVKTNYSDRAAMLESKFKKKFKELIYLNLKNFGYWINAASFIVSYTFIMYVFFNLGTAATSSEKGVVRKPFLFIYL